MNLKSGTRLGPYEIFAPLGAGGMGEVFRARDTRLDRCVAIKVLPLEFAHDAQLRLRLEREAKAISQLNHPHICTLYDIGHDEGTDYLVMELIDGQSLADRLAKGPLPIEQVLRYGVQIADALDKAHRQGIVHRDLKPGNIMLTKAGAKLLDFGLAKSDHPALSTQHSALQTEHKPLTVEGTIVGTCQYMAPEQLEGLEADARTDVFALGALLYEMATGRRAFDGKTKTSLIAAIVSSEPPPISQVQPLTPPALEHVIRKCLAKDREDRWQSAHDIAAELRWISEAGSQAGVAAPAVRRRKRREWLAWSVAAAFIAATALLAYAYARAATRASIRYEFEVGPPAGSRFNPVDGPVVVSPNGQYLAFGIANGAIGVRNLASKEIRAIPGTEGAYDVFWSADSKSLGFFTAGKLKRIDLSGGAPRTIATIGDSRGGTWNNDGAILFSSSTNSGLSRVASAGGTVTRVTSVDTNRELGHWRPHFLPDGRRFIYFSRGLQKGTSRVYAATLGSAEKPSPVMELDTAPTFAPPDLLLFTSEGSLLAQRLNMRSLKPERDPFAVAEGVEYSTLYGSLAASVSANGILAYQQPSGSETSIVGFDRSGKEIARYEGGTNLDLSRDGTRVAYQRGDRGRTDSLWVLDVKRGTHSRLTFETTSDFGPVWSPDGTQIIYASFREKGNGIYSRSSTSGVETLLHPLPSEGEPIDWSLDGRFILLEIGGSDVHVLSVADRKMAPFLANPGYGEHSGRFSPDGRVITYVSNESNINEIFVQPFPPTGAKWQVSSGGGFSARWRADGKELFYVSKGTLMSVEITRIHPFETSAPRELFKIDSADYVVSPDGQTIWASKRDLAEALPIHVVVNWRPAR